MEKATHDLKSTISRVGKIFSTLSSMAALLTVSSVWADAVFAPSEPREDPMHGPVERFPESRFGAPPMRIDTGVDRGYASRAVIDMETSDEADATPTAIAVERRDRSPASLEVQGEKAASIRKHPAPPARNLAPLRSGAESPEVAVNETAAGSSGDLLPSAVARRGVQEIALIASDLGFFPRTIFVSRDVPVRIFVTGASKNTLCIMLDSFQVRKQVRSQKIEEITFTPATPGKYRFYCPVNGMEGTMIVKELSTDEPGASNARRSVARVSASDVLDH